MPKWNAQIIMKWPKSVDPQSIQAYASLALVCITLWYASISYNMAATMKDEYELRLRPYLAIDPAIVNHSSVLDTTGRSRLKFQFQNVSQIPLTFTVTKLEFMKISFLPTQASAIIFPGQTVSFFAEPMKLLEPIQKKAGVIEIEFSATPKGSPKYFVRRSFHFGIANESLIDEDVYDKL